MDCNGMAVAIYFDRRCSARFGDEWWYTLSMRSLAVILEVWLLAILTLHYEVSASVLPKSHKSQLGKERSSSGSYTPENVTCPNLVSFIKTGLSLSSREAEFKKDRQAKTDSNLRSFAKSAGLRAEDIARIFRQPKLQPTVAAAFSGGGFRAMLNGAGVLSAMDARTSADQAMAGLLDVITYISGLSGGSWLIGSVAVNGFSSVDSLSSELWDLENKFLTPGGWNVFKTMSHYNKVSKEVKEKREAGFETSVTDYWGRMISHKVIDKTGGSAVSLSDIQYQKWFQGAQYPYPIIVANGRDPGVSLTSQNSTVWEMSPYDFGSWDNGIRSLIPMEYLGTKLNNGVVNGSCVQGFDNAGFIVGTSSSLFNLSLQKLNLLATGVLKTVLGIILSGLAKDNADIAVYPNPFKGLSRDGFVISDMVFDRDYLDLVDGGEDGQNIPLWPLLHPERSVDVIFAVDSSADTELGWPNGTSLVATYSRSKNPSTYLRSHISGFPVVPDQNTVLNLGLNLRPTFFGCNLPTNSTKKGTEDRDTVSPVVVYLPNSLWSYKSNTSTFDSQYTDEQKQAMIQNGFNMASQSSDPNWKACLSCAIMHRSIERLSIKQPDICKRCLNQYCWDGTTNTTEPSTEDQQRLIDAAVANRQGKLTGPPVMNYSNLTNSTSFKWEDTLANDTVSRSTSTARNSSTTLPINSTDGAVPRNTSTSCGTTGPTHPGPCQT